jgi:hypothetical protein
MASHSLIVYASDSEQRGAGVDFADQERWNKYVPIRLPWTQLVQERLPAGAAGVLLNRSHPFHDLILVLDAPDRRLFEAIDGRRSIAEIAGGPGRTAGDRARRLFERLWGYDQVVFDASGG